MNVLTEQEQADLAEILRLHDEAFKHYLVDDFGHKSGEGCVELSFGNFWDRDGYDNPGAPGRVAVGVYSYALGPSRMHYFDTIAEGLSEVRKWHRTEMGRRHGE